MAHKEQGARLTMAMARAGWATKLLSCTRCKGGWAAATQRAVSNTNKGVVCSNKLCTWEVFCLVHTVLDGAPEPDNGCTADPLDFNVSALARRVLWRCGCGANGRRYHYQG